MLTIPMLFAFLLVLASAFQSPNLLLCLGWQDGRASRCLLKKHHFLLPTRFVRVHVSREPPIWDRLVVWQRDNIRFMQQHSRVGNFTQSTEESAVFAVFGWWK